MCMKPACSRDNVLSTGMQVRALIAALPTCVTREQCDTLAENFVLVQSKGARTRMVRTAARRRLMLKVDLHLCRTSCGSAVNLVVYLTLHV